MITSLIIFNATLALAETGHHAESGDMEHWEAPASAPDWHNLAPDTAAVRQRGAALYAELCAACHGAQARGLGLLVGALATPPANLRASAAEHSDGELAWKIASGRGLMPGWGGVLGQENIGALLRYLRALPSDTGETH
ncbi:MAG: c-type cytochrome [Gammaproteobacteria bacterium]|nr:c-type cytochrome [Gammaproteobacteria bacterium]